MVVAMTLAALISFGQIVLALLLLYLCGALIYTVRQVQPSALVIHRERPSTRNVPQRDA